MSTISLFGIELWTRIGVPEEERQAEQRVLVDLVLECAGTAGTTDNLKDTVNYEELMKSIRALACEERKTIEKLAEDVAATCLEIEGVESAVVTVHKFVLPGTKEVSISIARS